MMNVRIQVDATEVSMMLARLGADVPEFIEELIGELSNVIVAEETKLTPIARRDWDPTGEHRKGELMRSISEQKDGDDRIIGPTAVSDARGKSPGGYPYGVSVVRGVAWGGRKSSMGPRDFPQKTIDLISPHLNEIMDRTADAYMRRHM